MLQWTKKDIRKEKRKKKCLWNITWTHAEGSCHATEKELKVSTSHIDRI
jgi:hypothetical protein